MSVRVLPGRQPPRVLVAAHTEEGQMAGFDEWCDRLSAQQTELRWDVMLVDYTAQPTKRHLGRMESWRTGHPFGRDHRVRLRRVGPDSDGQMFRSLADKRQFAQGLLWDKLASWSSYGFLFSLETSVRLDPSTLQRLFEADVPWAAAWMDGVRPALFHSLTLERWRDLTGWGDLEPLAYSEPPGVEPFPCSVTHLSCTLIRAEVVRRVPFRLSTAGELAYSWDVAKAGVQPVCIPAVRVSQPWAGQLSASGTI